ncbi:MAG: glucosidase [Verrucomicrobia bacterium]|nr:MAG: glucosidase [Verrucomicrobiota bacterium]
MNAEQRRIEENNSRAQRWHLWGPYLSDRQWGTVREDYSANGDAWNYLPHDHARSRAYRWGEDGLAGISDYKQRLCFAWAFWNGQDPILKERLFGLTGPQGNHGEDVKELYWYLDNTPSHSYMRMLYRYPQARFPYEQLVGSNAARSRAEPEFELWQTNVLAENRVFDIEISYAKATPDDLLIRATAINRGPEPATLHFLPTIWFRNTWSWGRDPRKPSLREGTPAMIEARHDGLGSYEFHCENVREFLFTENESNLQRLWGVPNRCPFVKDSVNDAVIQNKTDIVNPGKTGTKAAAHYRFTIPANESRTVRLRLMRVKDGAPGTPGSQELAPPVRPAESDNHPSPGDSVVLLSSALTGASRPSLPAGEKETVGVRATRPFDDLDEIFSARKAEADEFYAQLAPSSLTSERKAIQRQALAGLLWTKQFYYYIVEEWLEGDPGQPAPPDSRWTGRNFDWQHLYNERVMSMPDSWEFPWYASWDLAFHCIPLALVDPHFAKDQLDIVVREWYQHPNGQLPAYEWNFSDVNPPVLAWAAWRVFQIERKQSGKGDRAFLETIFHKLLLAFTWWVNRKDSEGNNIFQGGFLGLDNIGVFDRSASFPDGSHLEQSDGTSWMGMLSLNLMRIAIELARENHVYENIATKFFEHFLGIAAAMNNLGGVGLWDEEDEFYYDVLHTPGGRYLPLKVRSIVGLMPLLAVETIQWQLIDQLPGFKSRLEWYLAYRPQLASLVSRWQEPGMRETRLLALTRGHRMKCLLRRMLDPEEFLSDYGIRSVSKYHRDHPYRLIVQGEEKIVNYEAAESQTGIFGGNSNWRGPVWFPINYLLIESLQQFHHYYGDDFKVECPTGSGTYVTLKEVANELSNRLIKLWLRNEKGERPFLRASQGVFKSATDSQLYWFHEYFNGDNGAGLGASHQTGWTALVAKLIQQQGEFGTLSGNTGEKR